MLKTNVEAAEATLKELERLGKLSEADEAMITLLLSLAGAVDATPGNALLVRQYRDTLTALRGPREQPAPPLSLVDRMRSEVGDQADTGT